MIELGKQDDQNFFVISNFWRAQMHNRISYNQLASWLNREQSLNSSIEQTDLVNDYFDCLIECDDDQATCKRYCKTLLM